MLADRFRVVRLLGRGGMGEVYEVEDLELGERVAVKTLRSGLAVGERALALFRSEIQLARRVTHPNVCRIFDVFRHQRTAAGEQESVVFLTMELLAGETLSASLRRDGPLPLDEALPILRQVAAGLDAAHDAGVTHRDFKSGNVMLVAGDNGPRAVVTDFGLAGAEGVSGSRSPVFGTAPYRAPEQERGAAVGPAADLYAFGRVMREVLTGAAVGGERELPAAATQAVDQCLAERPEARPSRATSAVDAIAVALAQESRTPWLGATLLALVVLAVGFVAWRAYEGLPEAAVDGMATAAGVPAPVAQTMVAVVGGYGAERRAHAVAVLLAAELQGTPVALLDGWEYGELGLGEEGRRGDWRAGLAAMGVDLVVDVASGGEPRATISAAAGGPGAEESASDLVQLAAALGERLRRHGGGVRAPPDVRRALVGDDPQAVALYAQALATDGEAAFALHREAIERQPEAAFFQLGLAVRLLRIGRRDEAREPARQARRRVADLDEDVRLWADYQIAEAEENVPMQFELLERLAAKHPERRGYGLSLAQLAIDRGRVADAGEQLTEMLEQTPELAGDPRYNILVAMHAYGVGRQEERLAAASRAADLFRRFGARRPEFSALLNQHDALRLLERFEEDDAVLDRAEQLARESGQLARLGHVERWRGVSLLARGETMAARRAFERSLAIARQAGD
ncbi:MAG TPA: protein kinase, partial [Thermoanaerobaculia bacterium]|nr:protein kinase [Thermoanaerobaculia bacterium]